MGKLFFSFVAVIIIFISLFIGAIFYLDMSGHKELFYYLVSDGRHIGNTSVDRFITEDKIVFKSSAFLGNAVSYPKINKKISLKRTGLLPVRYFEESVDDFYGKKLIVVTQKDEMADYLFVEAPRYFFIKDLQNGRKTLIFDPYDITSYCLLFEKYNFWKKGTQFFEVLIPSATAVSPMRDKLAIEYSGETIVTFSGRKTEVDRYSIRSASLKTVTVMVSKYSHNVIFVDIPAECISFELSLIKTGTIEKYLSHVRNWVSPLLAKEGEHTDKGGNVQNICHGFDTKNVYADINYKNIVFESPKGLVSGKFFCPEGKGPFPSLIVIPGDRSVYNSDIESDILLVKYFVEKGYAILTFSYPPVDSNGINLDDPSKIAIAINGVKLLTSNNGVDNDRISLLSHSTGGYIALRVAEKIDDVKSVILIGSPISYEKLCNSKKATSEVLSRIEKNYNIGPFDKAYEEFCADKLFNKLKTAMREEKNILFVQGIKLPTLQYKEFLNRQISEAIIGSNKPVFMILGKNEISYSRDFIKAIEEKVFSSELNSRNKLIIVPKIFDFISSGKKVLDNGFVINNNQLYEMVFEWLNNK